MKTQRGVEVYLYSFFTLGTRWRWLFNITPPPLYIWERDLAEWVPGLVWTGVENFIPTGIQSPDLQPVNES